MPTSTTVKAIRATILLGDIELDVFQLPDSSYVINSTDIAEAINIHHARVAEICATKQAQKLIGTRFEAADFSPNKLKCSDSGNISGYSTDVAYFIWQYEATKGNQLAESLVFSTGVEALERRADQAFGVLRTEQERNQGFEIRKDGILSRNFWTDTVEWYIKNNEVSDSYKRFVYINVSDGLNRQMFGMTSKQLKEYYGLKSSESVRDFLPSDTLKLVDSIEKAVAVRVRKTGVEPKQALKEMLVFLGVDPDTSLL